MKMILHSKYRRKNPDEKTKTEIIKIIEEFKKEKKPLKFVVLFGGYKNPNTGMRIPGMNELLTIKRLSDFVKKIGNIYPYGVGLYIITTGKKGEIANGITSDLTAVYESQIKRIAVKNFCDIKVIPIAELYKTLEIAEQIKVIIKNRNNGNGNNIQKEKLKIAKKHSMTEITEHEAVRNAKVYEDLTEIEPIILEEYFGCHIKLSFRKEAEDGAISLYTCKKGMAKQPWNGTCNGCKYINHCLSHIKTGKIIYL